MSGAVLPLPHTLYGAQRKALTAFTFRVIKMAFGDCILWRRLSAALMGVELGADSSKKSRFRVTAAVNVTIAIFWEMTSCTNIPIFLTNLIPPSAGLKTFGVARSEVLAAVLVNIQLFWDVTLRLWALPTFRKTPLPLLLSVQKSRTIVQNTRYSLQDLTLVAFYQITRCHHRIPKWQRRCRVDAAILEFAGARNAAKRSHCRLGGSKRCRGLGNKGEGMER